jgi:hypothetical protein
MYSCAGLRFPRAGKALGGVLASRRSRCAHHRWRANAMRRITALTNSGLAFLVIFASVPIAWAGESNAGPATGPAQLWSTCFVRGPYPTVYVSAVLRPPWTDEKPKAFSAFVTKKYGVSTYQPTCLSAVSRPSWRSRSRWRCTRQFRSCRPAGPTPRQAPARQLRPLRIRSMTQQHAAR